MEYFFIAGFISGASSSIFHPAGGFIMAFPIGFIADKVGRKYMVIITSLLIAIGSAGMFFIAGFISGASSSIFHPAGFPSY